MALVWTYREWGQARPSLSSDELYRHTLVLPVPFVTTSVDEEDGTRYHPALVVVVRPWWACRDMLDPEVRRYVRWERAMNRQLYRLPDDVDEQAIDAVLNRWEPLRPPTPAAWLR